MKTIFFVFFFLLVSLISTSCKSLDIVKTLQVNDDGTLYKLPTLTLISDSNMILANEQSVRISKLNNEQIALINKEFNSIFIRELETNLTNPYGESKGYIQAQIITNDLNSNGFMVFYSLLSLGTLNLIGLPFNHPEYTLNFEFSIYDKNKKLIKKYNIYGKGQAWAAAYYGYSGQNAIKLAMYRGFKDALKQLKFELQQDYDMLNQKFK